MLRCLLLLMLLCAPIAPLSAGAAEFNATAAEWPQWRGPNRDGLSPETGLNTNWDQRAPTLLSTIRGLGQGYASVSIADGLLFTTGNFPESQAVVAVDLEDGSIAWKTNLTQQPPKHGYEGSRSTPTIDEDRLYVVTSDGEIVCLKSADGEVVWRKDFRKEWNGKMMSGWGFSESPLVDGDRVICTPGGPNAMMVALDKMNGREIWRSEVPSVDGRNGAAYSSAVVSEGGGVRQYVQLVGQGVIGVRAEDGKMLWGYSKIANTTANIPTPIVSGDFVFSSTGYGAGAALLRLRPDRRNAVKAEEVYFLPSKTLQNHHGGMVLVDEHVYCGHGHDKGFPICVALRNGKVMWGGELRGAGSGSAAVVYADGHLVFRYQSGEVALIEANPREYRLKGVLRPEVTNPPCWAHPVVAGGRLFLRDQDTLMVYDLSQN